MARGRKKNSDDRSYMFTREQKLDIIRRTFPELRALTLKKAALQAEHIKPVADSINMVGRRMKAETGVERADWLPDFMKYMRDQNAIDMDSQADTDRIQCNLKLMHDALTTGETVNFMDVLERMSTRPDPMLQQEGAEADDDGQTEHASAEEGAQHGPAELTFASTDREEGDPMLEETTRAWAATDGEEGNDEAFDKGGYTFAAGKKAGAEGVLAVQNPHGEGNDAAALWERGRIVGAKDFLASEAASIADEHEADEPATSAKVVNLFDGGGEGDEEFPPAEMLGGGEGHAAATAL